MQFTLGKLFFMFDSSFRFNVLRLPWYTENLSAVNSFPLQKVNESDQNEIFGCAFQGFFDFYNMTETYNSKNESFLLFYQCPDKHNRYVLKVAKITAYNDAYE